MGLSRPKVRKHLNTVEEPKYERVQSSAPRLGQFEEQLTKWLEEEAKLARPRRRTAHRQFEGLQEIGYNGAYDSVQRFVKRWKSTNHGPKHESKKCETGPSRKLDQHPFYKIATVS